MAQSTGGRPAKPAQARKPDASKKQAKEPDVRQQRPQRGSRVSLHREEVGNHEAFVVPHVEGGTVSIVGFEFTGGGTERGFTLDYVVVEPASQDDFKRCNVVSRHLSRLPRED